MICYLQLMFHLDSISAKQLIFGFFFHIIIRTPFLNLLFMLFWHSGSLLPDVTLLLTALFNLHEVLSTVLMSTAKKQSTYLSLKLKDGTFSFRPRKTKLLFAFVQFLSTKSEMSKTFWFQCL